MSERQILTTSLHRLEAQELDVREHLAAVLRRALIHCAYLNNFCYNSHNSKCLVLKFNTTGL